MDRTRGGRKVLRPTLDDKRSVEARSRSNRQPFCRWVPPIVTVRGGCYFLFRSAMCFPCAPTYAHARQRSARGEADDERRLHVGRADHHLGVGREDAVPSITQHLGRQRHLHLHARQKTRVNRPSVDGQRRKYLRICQGGRRVAPTYGHRAMREQDQDRGVHRAARTRDIFGSVRWVTNRCLAGFFLPRPPRPVDVAA